MTTIPRLGITVGDPAGIGPEVTAKALADPQIRNLAEYVVFGDRQLWREQSVGKLPFDFHKLPLADYATADAASHPVTAGTVTLVELPDVDYEAIGTGRVTLEGGKVSVQYIMAAIDAVQAGRLDGIVTGPINKEAIRQAGYPWPGHTEMFAEKFAAQQVAMMFAGGPFRVVLVTIHMSLRKVLESITQERVLSIVQLTHQALRELFGIERPVLAVCGLNPHAGEAGRFGDEEELIIIPALEQARSQGIDVRGPLPSDTIYRAAMKGQFDIVVAMYHDQGLIPIKTIAFEDSVNITIGIPAVRTSVDHGTAFDIAGRNMADPSSMKSAIRMAVQMVEARRNAAARAGGRK